MHVCAFIISTQYFYEFNVILYLSVGDSVNGRRRAATTLQRGQSEIHGSMDNVFSSTPYKLQPNPPNYTMKRYASTHSLLPTTIGASKSFCFSFLLAYLSVTKS